jgi:hypothetical protein
VICASERNIYYLSGNYTNGDMVGGGYYRGFSLIAGDNNGHIFVAV